MMLRFLNIREQPSKGVGRADYYMFAPSGNVMDWQMLNRKRFTAIRLSSSFKNSFTARQSC